MAFEFEAQNEEHYAVELQKQNREANAASAAPVLFLKKGITQLRVLPPAVGSNGIWMRQYLEHYVASAEPVKYFTCRASVGEDCPICEKAAELLEMGREMNDESLIEQAKQLKAKVQYLANVYVYSSPEAKQSGLDKGTFVMKFGTMVKRELLELNQDVDGWADITNPAEGVDIKITRQGERLNTKYIVTPMPKRTNIQEQLAAQGLDINADGFGLYKLDEVYPVKSYEELQTVVAAPKASTPVESTPQPIESAPVVAAPAAPLTPTPIAPAAMTPMAPSTTMQIPTMPPPPPSVVGDIAPPPTKEEQ
jgi:hypothetical protein